MLKLTPSGPKNDTWSAAPRAISIVIPSCAFQRQNRRNNPGPTRQQNKMGTQSALNAAPEAKRAREEAIAEEQEAISKRFKADFTLSDARDTGADDAPGAEAPKPAKKSKNKKKRAAAKADEAEGAQQLALAGARERRIARLQRNATLPDKARVRKVFAQFTKAHLDARAVNRVRQQLDRVGFLPGGSVTRQGSHLTYHGSEQKSLTFVRPHGRGGVVGKKELERRVGDAVGA